MLKYISSIITTFIFLNMSDLNAQVIQFDQNTFQPVNVSMSVEKLAGKDMVKVIKDSTIKAVDQPTFVKIGGHNFKNGIIEVNVMSRLLPYAPSFARGFIGIAFRVNDSSNKFECIYLRPANGRADDQLRRNHAIQYFSYPGYDFEYFRKEAPGQYEAYADMGLNEWIKLKIEVNGAKARLFLNNNSQPSLIVNDLKHGPDVAGAIGLWVDIGTEGFFSDLKVYRNK